MTTSRWCRAGGTAATWMALAVAACAGGGDTSDEAAAADPPVLPPTGIVGQLFAGKVDGAKVTATTEQGQSLGSASLGPDGTFGFDLGTYQGTIVLSTTGGTYMDLATGQSKPLPELRTVASADRLDRPACVAQINPLSELAFRLKDGGRTWGEAAGYVTALSAGADALCAPVPDPTLPSMAGRPRDADAAIAIAGISALASSKGTSLDAALGEIAAGIAKKDAAVGEALADATDTFLSGPRNQTGLTTMSSGAPSTVRVIVANPVAIPIYYLVPKCGAVLPKNPAVPAASGVQTVGCGKPNVAASVTVKSDVPRIPDGSHCGDANPDKCATDEIDHCPGAHCIQAIRPAQSKKVWKLCNWFTSPAECPGGMKIAAPETVTAPKACPPDGCPPRIELVLPSDHNIDGTLIAHDKGAWLGAFQIASQPTVSPAFRPGEHCPSSKACYQVARLELAPGDGTESRSASFLTMYGHEWTMSFTGSRAKGAVTYCDILSGQCFPEAAPGVGGSGGGDSCGLAVVTCAGTFNCKSTKTAYTLSGTLMPVGETCRGTVTSAATATQVATFDLNPCGTGSVTSGEGVTKSQTWDGTGKAFVMYQGSSSASCTVSP